jgi:predicted dinucleotide-binding enzyme
MMKIGVIGAGNVGGTLGKAWVRKGHEVVFGVRDPQREKVQDLLKDIGSKAHAGSVAEAAAFGEVVVLAVPWSAARDAIQKAGDLSGKVVVDVTNARALPSSCSAAKHGT